MTRGDLDFSVPFLDACRDCGRWAVVWAFCDEIGEGERTQPLCGRCGDPERCGRRLHGYACEAHAAALIPLLAELDVEGRPGGAV